MNEQNEAPVRWECSRILLGLLVVYAVFESSAQWLGSDRGQAGLIVGAIVVLACVGVERALFGQPLARAWRALGLGLPAGEGCSIAIVVVTALLLLLVGVAQWSAVSIEWSRDAIRLVPGLFAQAGIGEETLFRGYLFRHFRARRSSWHAATLSMLPFAALHVLLFLYLPWYIALLGLLTAIALSFPLARLFEIGGNTIWPPALVHFVIQAVPKITAVTGAPSWAFPLLWMVTGVAVSWLILAIRDRLRDPFPLRHRPPVQTGT